MSGPVYRRAVVLSRQKLEANFARITELHNGNFELVIPDAVVDRFAPALAEVFELTKFRKSSQPKTRLMAQVPLTHLLGVEGKNSSEATQAIWLQSHILGIREAAKGEAVSYGGTRELKRKTLIGLAPIGFADGIDRKLSGSLKVLAQKAQVKRFSTPWNLEVLGRIAMDSISIDLTEAKKLEVGDTVFIFHPESQFSIMQAAQLLGITPGEVALRLSERAEVIVCQ